MRCLHIEVAKIPNFSFRVERSPLHWVFFFCQISLTSNLIFSCIDLLSNKRGKYLKYICAVPSLRFRSNTSKQGWSHIKKAGCIQLFQIIILKSKFLWKSFLLISSHSFFTFFMKILTPDWLLGKLSFRSCIKKIYINQEVNKRYVPSFLMLRKELECFIKAIGNFCITFSNYFPFSFLFFSLKF